jgi:2-oxoisovalerate dehydrogenase E1 component beta subunit
MNLFQAINSAMKIAMETNPRTVHFGEDVLFGGVFRCSMGLSEQFGRDRVFNTPLSEQGIAGFSIGMAAMGYDVIAEMQFADYIFPGFDQIVNEAAKWRYRTGSTSDVGGLVFRAPCGGVGHGALYHSQSVEAYFAHCPGLVIVIPRGPKQAKGLLLSSIRRRDPVLFFEPKALYRAAVDDDVPVGDYMLPIGEAEIVREGTDVTLLGWAGQVRRCLDAAESLKTDHGISAEVIDLQTIVPWDRETVLNSVQKTGRLVITHEATMTNGFGAEIAAEIGSKGFLNLKAPVARVTGFDAPFPLAWEEFYIPNKFRIIDQVLKTVGY